MSLFDAEGNNAFFDPNDPKGMQLSETAYHFLGGLIKHAYNYTAIMNQQLTHTNVWFQVMKRLFTLLGLVVTVRHLCAYLLHVVWELVLSCVQWIQWRTLTLLWLFFWKFLYGIENKIEAPAPIEENIYIMTAEERKEAGITDLPSTLHNALKALTEDEVVKAALGDHIYTSFLEAKRIEWASYATFVSQWEIDNYLDLY
ncbi:glutamate-ammonia ligase [Streptococcus pneumoniae]|nr:glutamate-ammonia ligase [Streptococcus pneumoniae]